ncbi:hypothetical protein Trydic_g13604 [Trypoxylus dichotomus]
MKRYEDVEGEVSALDEVSECHIESEHDTELVFDASESAESDEVGIVKSCYGIYEHDPQITEQILEFPVTQT